LLFSFKGLPENGIGRDIIAHTQGNIAYSIQQEKNGQKDTDWRKEPKTTHFFAKKFLHLIENVLFCSGFT
jgi:hypothetical protein